MKWTLVALLLCLTIQPARATMIWTLWCTEPGAVEETPRKGQWDTSAKCHQSISTALSDADVNCHDTKQGPRFGEKDAKVKVWEGLPNCTAVRKFYQSCTCKLETLQ
jgi:hypothetical protein